MKLFPQDYEHLKVLIDKAAQTNKDFVFFKGIKLSLWVAKRIYTNKEKL